MESPACLYDVGGGFAILVAQACNTLLQAVLQHARLVNALCCRPHCRHSCCNNILYLRRVSGLIGCSPVLLQEMPCRVSDISSSGSTAGKQSQESQQNACAERSAEEANAVGISPQSACVVALRTEFVYICQQQCGAMKHGMARVCSRFCR
jgi:hypothetical protein